MEQVGRVGEVAVARREEIVEMLVGGVVDDGVIDFDGVDVFGDLGGAVAAVLQVHWEIPLRKSILDWI